MDQRPPLGAVIRPPGGRPHRFRLKAGACLLWLLLAWILPAEAAAQSVIRESWAEHEAGKWVRFNARVRSNSEIESALVFFQARNDTHTGVGEARIQRESTGEFKISYTHQIAEYYIRPFTEISYRWEISFEDGQKHRSPAYPLFYGDNRFEWNSLEEHPFRVHWYEGGGDVPFAQTVIDVAQSGFDRAQDYLPLPIPQAMDIYIYTDSKTLQGILNPDSRDWIAGHADPDLGVIVAALPPGPDQQLLLRQRIPHELMHVLLYRYAEPGYNRLPSWLTEGLATLVELVPNSDYETLLNQAVESKRLFSMTSLCGPFPHDAPSALLSYAQSASFVRYLHGQYGLTGMDALVKAYANGLDCERGSQQALGRSLPQLERNWRGDVLAENVAATAFNNLLPWLVLALAMFGMPAALIVIGLMKKR